MVQAGEERDPLNWPAARCFVAATNVSNIESEVYQSHFDFVSTAELRSVEYTAKRKR